MPFSFPAMRIVDLTLAIPLRETQQDGPHGKAFERETVCTQLWSIDQGPFHYTARVHDLHHWGMAGTYLDFPGHIVETDDGADAATVAVERLYRLRATLIRLNRADAPGCINARELADACPGGQLEAEALVLNALGSRRFDEVQPRSVYLGRDAVKWITDSGVRVLVSDVYESGSDPQGVFLDLFRNGVYAVCCPVNLDRLDRPHFRLTVLPLRFTGATQLPCRLVAELED